MGTAWAAVALMEALPDAAQPSPLPLADWTPAELPSWSEAALSGSVDDLRKLLDGGLDGNAATPAGTTVLMMASRDAAKVRLLLERGADPHRKAMSGLTALTTASLYRGSANSIRLLLDKGVPAKVGTGVKYGMAPLIWASYNGDVESAKLLLEHGAEPNKVSLLIGQIPVTPVLLSTLSGNAEMLRVLLQNGGDPDWKNRAGLSLLDGAVLANYPAAVEALLEAGAKVDHADMSGYTPLLYAAAVSHGNSAVAEALLRAGASRELRAKDGADALTIAEKNGNLEVKKVLLPASARRVNGDER